MVLSRANTLKYKASPLSEKRPNIIVFFTDQQRHDTTGVHGNPPGLTPNFDRLAAQGTHLFNTFTCQPVCGPARSCMQTGLYATRTGCFRNGIPLPSWSTPIAERFNDAGYNTAYIGKWHLAATKGEPVPEHLRGGYKYWLAADAIELITDAYYTVVYDNDNKLKRLPGYRVDALTDAAIRYIDEQQNSDSPFFLYLSLLEPHQQNHRDQFVAPDGYEEQYTGRWLPPDLHVPEGSAARQIGGYYGMVKRIDEALGRLVDTLKSLGTLENTIILFTSDHGCHFKTRAKEYKRSCHESSIRVPTMMCGPGFNGGGRVEELVSLIDLPPTLLDAAGIDVPEDMDGRPVQQLLRREAHDWPDDVFIQISEAQVGRAIRTKRWKYSVSSTDKSGHDGSKSDSYEEEFLYDLESDPYEQFNLAGLDPFSGVAKELRERLLARIKTVEGYEPEIVPAPSRPAGQRKPGID